MKKFIADSFFNEVTFIGIIRSKRRTSENFEFKAAHRAVAFTRRIQVRHLLKSVSQCLLCTCYVSSSARIALQAPPSRQLEENL